MLTAFRTTILIVFFLSTISSFAQNTNDRILSKEQAIIYAHLSDSLYAAKTDSSIYYGLAAICTFEELHMIKEAVDTRNGLTGIYYGITKDPNAARYSARIAYQLAMQYLSFNDEVTSAAMNNYALIVLEEMSNYRAELDYFKQILDKAKKPRTLAGASYNAATRYFEIGDFSSALTYYQSAADYYHQVGEPSRFKKVGALVELGRTYHTLQRHQDAIETFTSALAIPIPPNQDPSVIYRCHYYLAVAYFDNQQAARAIYHLSECRQGISNGQELYFDALYLSGKIQADQGNWKRVNAIIDELQQLPDSFDQTKQSRYIQLAALAAWQQNNKEVAFSLLNKAIDKLYAGLSKAEQLPQGDILTDCESPYELDIALKTKGTWLIDTGDSSSLKQALNVHYQRSYIRDQARIEFQNKDAQLLLLARSKTLYEGALSIIFRLTELDSSTDYHSDALFFIEKSKANILLDELYNGRIHQHPQFPNIYRQQVDSLKQEIRWQNKLIDNATNETQIIEAKRTKNTLERALKDIQQLITNTFPFYDNLTKQNSLTLTEVKSTLIANNEVMINMLYGEQWLYVLSFSSSAVFLERFPANQYSADQVNVFIRSLSMLSADEQLYKTLAFKWYEELINLDKFRNPVSKIRILPDAHLAQIPFSALLTREEEASVGKLPYLIRQVEIQQAYSASILQQQNQLEAVNDRFLGVYPIFKSTSQEQHYIAEQSSVFSQYKGKHLKHDFANKEHFIEVANQQDFALLFLATHAQASDSVFTEPSINFIDESMSLSEFGNRQFNIHLAVLSACETNIGEYYKGEGVMSIARGFTLSGIPSLITTLWKVNETSTISIMLGLFDELEAGKSKSKALQKAQLAYLDSNIPEQEKIPLYWSGIVTMGNMSSIDIHKRSNAWLISLVMFSFCLVFILSSTKKQNIRKH